MTDIQNQNIKDMRSQGVGYTRIAEALGLSVNTVKSYCQRNGLGIGIVPVVVESPTSICKYCGKPLDHNPKTKRKTFCSNSCRYSYWNANPEQRQTAQHSVCACCGKVFTSAGSRKYCGHPCYIESRYKMGGTGCVQRAI